MKKYILTFFAVSTLILNIGCEDFLDKPQLDIIEDNDKFWRNESDFRMYSVEFYSWFLSGYNSGYTTNYAPLRGYTFSDDVCSGEGKQENFISSVPAKLGVASIPGKLLEQTWLRQYSGERWNFGWVRKANVMLQRVENYKGNLSEAAYKHWSAVGRFFRAYAYFNLVVSFGDVPYFDKPIDETDQKYMFKDRDDRGFVMDKVYEDLQYAMANAYEKDNNSTQYVNRDLIAALTTRFMLFEGTWQKYHKLSDERAKKYLQLCTEAAEMIMKSGKYSCSKDFRSLFGSDNLAGHPEVIFYRHYATAKALHSIASYSNGDEGQNGVNLQLLKAFICTDGQPYQTSTVPNAKDFNLSVMAKTRDPRFEATFFNFPRFKATSMVYADKFISREGASYWAPDKIASRPAQFGGSLNENDAPIVRYAEVLLDWIEAKAELAESYGGTALTQEDIDKTINAIRNRPLDNTAKANGVEKTKPLQLSSLPDDPARDTDVSKILWEIRRERRMEFVYEHTRLLDIKRWKKLSYMDNNKYPDTMYGAWVNFPKDVPNFLSESYIGLLTVRNAEGKDIVYDGDNKDQMVGFYKIPNVEPRDAFDEEKAYLSPVGVQDMQQYSDYGFKLSQTKAWQ